MKKFFRDTAKLLVGLVILAAPIAAYAGSVPLFTGPSGINNPIGGLATNPSVNPANVPDMNLLVTQFNSQISQTGLFTGGFQTPSQTTLSSTGSLTWGLLVPYTQGFTTTGTPNHSQAVGFITFVATNGVQSFIPYWQ